MCNTSEKVMLRFPLNVLNNPLFCALLQPWSERMPRRNRSWRFAWRNSMRSARWSPSNWRRVGASWLPTARRRRRWTRSANSWPPCEISSAAAWLILHEVSDGREPRDAMWVDAETIESIVCESRGLFIAYRNDVTMRKPRGSCKRWFVACQLI